MNVQRGCHLDFAQAVADAVKTAAERAEEAEDSLKTFMFVIPRVRIDASSRSSVCRQSPLQQSTSLKDVPAVLVVMADVRQS